MSSCVAELDAFLQSMLVMKAPGVTGSKISSITQLCNANIQSESVLIQKIYTHFKKAPATHKLGVLYVVDSVTRSWVEQARKAGQQPGPTSAYGTFGAGVNRVTELLPMLMNDIINSAPEDQKVRLINRISLLCNCAELPGLQNSLLVEYRYRIIPYNRLESENWWIFGNGAARFRMRCFQTSKRG